MFQECLKRCFYHLEEFDPFENFRERYLHLSLDNVRASDACEACEPGLRGMRAKVASQHANHTVIES